MIIGKQRRLRILDSSCLNSVLDRHCCGLLSVRFDAFICPILDSGILVSLAIFGQM
jgi:hypothetical protein